MQLLHLHLSKHSLYYIYTALSKPVDLPGIYQFTAMAQLDDIQIDYYNSREQRKIPKQTWMKEKLYEDYWEEGTQSRKSKEHWFNVNIDILMKRMRHSESDLHVFQMRTGCEVERWGSEEKFSKGVYEYGYDGENFLSFDDSGSLQFTQLYQPRVNIPFLNQYTKGYLGKNCVDWLKKFTEYGENELRNGSPPDVHMFAKRSTSDKIKLTCMVTSFYPKDTVLFIRKYRTSLPEDETESTGIRPNQDGAFQLCKSVEIQENEKANYDCFVAHRTLKEPIITKWDGNCQDCPPEIDLAMIAAVTGAVLVLLITVAGVVVCILKKKGIIGDSTEENNVVSKLLSVTTNMVHKCLGEGQMNSSDVLNSADKHKKHCAMSNHVRMLLHGLTPCLHRT
uniref:Ig-like domain-containing protein n=1 Tax=Sinocyclocheilus grahami TaxID=75366 RepID=A0A672KYK8_SINGR